MFSPDLAAWYWSHGGLPMRGGTPPSGLRAVSERPFQTPGSNNRKTVLMSPHRSRLAASILPPTVAAVIALGRGARVRSRVFAFVLAAAITTCATGLVREIRLEVA
jgi:hypothetical protein